MVKCLLYFLDWKAIDIFYLTFISCILLSKWRSRVLVDIGTPIILRKALFSNISSLCTLDTDREGYHTRAA